MARKLEERERQKHKQEADNIDSSIKRPISSPKYFEQPEPITTEKDYHTTMFNMSQNRYPYARELMETYHQKLSLNLINNKNDQAGEEDEDLGVGGQKMLPGVGADTGAVRGDRGSEEEVRGRGREGGG